MWFELCRIGGNPDAAEAVERVAEGLTDRQLAEAKQLVEQWRARHGEAGAGS
jgi:hypothetical protein